MTQYQISNSASGVTFGVYEGETESEAWEALVLDAGGIVEERGDDIVIEEMPLR